jgi:hypothetical protein
MDCIPLQMGAVCMVLDAQSLETPPSSSAWNREIFAFSKIMKHTEPT